MVTLLCAEIFPKIKNMFLLLEEIFLEMYCFGL
jgi:hypothetical protein